MSTPTPTPAPKAPRPQPVTTPRPPRPNNKLPNPFFMLGLFVAASTTFLLLAERRSKDPRHSAKEFNAPHLPSAGGKKIDMPEFKPVEGMN